MNVPSIGIIAAQIEEALPLIERLRMNQESPRLYTKNNLVLCISGVGKLNAASATYFLYSVYKVNTVINIGVSAGRGDIHIGEIISVGSVYDGDFDISIFDHPKYYVPGIGDYILMQGRDPIRKLPCFSISQFLQGDIDTTIPDYIVDMEYYGIAHAALSLGIGSESIKIISDTDKEKSDVEYEENLHNCSSKLAEFLCSTLVKSEEFYSVSGLI